MGYQKTTIKYKLTLELESDFSEPTIVAQAKLIKSLEQEISLFRIYSLSDSNCRNISEPFGLSSSKTIRNLSPYNKIKGVVEILDTTYFVHTHSCNSQRFMYDGDENNIPKFKKDHTLADTHYKDFNFDEDGYLKIIKIEEEWFTKCLDYYVIVKEVK